MNTTVANGQAIWTAGTTGGTSTILLESETVETPDLQLDTKIRCPPQIEQSVIWPALRASKTKKKTEYNFYPSMVPQNNNNRKTVKDEEILAASISVVSTSSYSSHPSSQKQTTMHKVDKPSFRTPTPPSKPSLGKGTVFQVRQNRTVLQEKTSDVVRKPRVRQHVKNRAQMCQEYNNGISKFLSARSSSPLEGWLENDNGEEADTAWGTVSGDRGLEQPVNFQTSSRWWIHRNIWSENNEIETYDIQNNYNYITLTTQKAKRNKIHKFKRLMRRAKRRFRREQRRHFNSLNKKRTSYKRVSSNSKFYMKAQHQDEVQSNMDTNGSIGSEGKQPRTTSKLRRLQIERKEKEKQMEQDRLVLIEQLRQSRQQKRDSAYERALAVTEKRISHMDITGNLSSIDETEHDTEIKSPNNTSFEKYALARKQFRRNSPIEEVREPLLVSKITGKMSAMNQLFGKTINVSKKKHLKPTSPSRPTENSSSEQHELNFDDVESLAHRRR